MCTPFPYAWIEFARGVMWTEQAREPSRGETHYRRALAYLPEVVAANIHLAELEAARAAAPAAVVRLERVVAASDEPEARGLLGTLLVAAGERERGEREVARARAGSSSYSRVIRSRSPITRPSSDLGAGADPERAWALALLNLANRAMPRAFAPRTRPAGTGFR